MWNGGSRRLRSLSYRCRNVANDLLDRAAPRPPRAAAVTPEYRVLFVCLGNICRSPLAHGILRAKLADASLLGTVDVASAGTNISFPGRPPHPRARACARRHGINIGDLRASEFSRADFDRFDRIVVFDRTNLSYVEALAQSDDERSRVSLLLRGADSGEVPDPVLGGSADFENAFICIERGCEALMAEIQAELRSTSAIGAS